MKRSRFLGLSAALALGAAAPRTAAAADTGYTSVPFAAGAGGYATYRIPALVKTRSGALLAFAEGRLGGAGDSGAIDVVVKRSTDDGRTWGPLRVVLRGDGDTRGNPAPVVHPKTGRIVLLTCYNSGDVTEAQIMRGEAAPEQSRRVFVQVSTDDSRRFGPPRELTAGLKRPEWRWYATGPGHAIALTRGPYAGRLVVPANHSTAPPPGSPDTGQEARYYGAHAVCSDDAGATWRLGYVDATYDGVINGNESTVAQLPDGRLYFSTRDHNGTEPGNRADTYSSDGGATLDRPYAIQHTLDDVPVVQASVLQTPGRGPLLFSGPSDPAVRARMALWRSDDAGAAFTKVLTLSEQRAAYSDLVALGGRTVGILYETRGAGPYETLEFRRLPLL